MKRCIVLLLMVLLGVSCQMKKVERLSDDQKDALTARALEIIRDPKNAHMLARLNVTQQELVKDTTPTVVSVEFPSRKKDEHLGFEIRDDLPETMGVAMVKWTGLLGIHCYVRFSGDLSRPAFCHYRVGVVPSKYVDVEQEFKEVYNNKGRK